MDNRSEVREPVVSRRAKVIPERAGLRSIGRRRVPGLRHSEVSTPKMPDDDLIPALLAASEVLGTGSFAAVAAEASPGKTVSVAGDGDVGLMGIVEERGDAGVAKIRELTDGPGAAFPPGSHPAHLGPEDRPREGLRQDPAAGPGRRGLHPDGPARCHQGPGPAMRTSDYPPLKEQHHGTR